MTPAERAAALAAAVAASPEPGLPCEEPRFRIDTSPYSAFCTEDLSKVPEHTTDGYPSVAIRKDVADAYADSAYAMGVAAHEQTAREKILRRTAESDQAYATVRELRSKLEEAEARSEKVFADGKAAQGAALSAETLALLAHEHDCRAQMIERLKAAEARATAAETRIARNEREAALYEGLVMQALLGKGLASIKTEDAPKLLTRLVERGVEAEWDDAAKGAG